MKKASAKTNRLFKSSPCGDALEVSLISPPLLIAAPLMPPSQLESKHVTQSTSEQYAPLGRVCPAIAPIDRHKQRIILAQNSLTLFIGSNLHNDVSAKRLIQAAQVAYDTRQLDTLALISQALTDHRHYKPIAAYYLGLAQQNLGKGNLTSAESLFEYAANYAPAQFRARAFLAIGAVSGYASKLATELSCYSQALSIPEADYWTRIEANRAIAFNYTLAGNYNAAISLLEHIAPMVRAVAPTNPRLYFDYLNNYAVNLHAVGRLQEAVRFSEIACASPLAIVYHEWGETRQEIRQDISARESAPVVFVVPQVQQEKEEKKESGFHRAKLIAPLKPVARCYLLSSLICTGLVPVGIIISRLECCHQRRGPPPPFRK
jgi:tetratricopeptide (TPR) repeat protein